MPQANKKFRKYYVDWWNIRKSTVYGIAAVLVFLILASLGGWWIARHDWFSKTGNAEIPKDAARLVSFEGDVRIVRAATRETILVTRETYLSAGDTIQTQTDGKAQVQMIDGSTLLVRPNSTVVIRDSSSIFSGQNVRVALDDGQINVKTQDLPEGTNNIVELKQSENRVFSQTDASFDVNQKSGDGEIRISRGGVETDAGGEKTIIKDGEYAAINPNGKLAPKEKLLSPPRLISPQVLEKIFASSNGTSDATFRWQTADGGAGFIYGLQIAASPFFLNDSIVIERESLASSSFSLANLMPGNYYWKVRATAPSGQTSEWSEPWKFTVVKREESKALTASDWNVEKLGGSVYLISGKTQPGATVRISGREIFASADGSFHLQISAQSAEITVEINDEYGNRARFALSLSTGVARQY
ncbi:MAG: FecR domain-containing protein [Pyrinomonadaceae bacterium]